MLMLIVPLLQSGSISWLLLPGSSELKDVWTVEAAAAPEDSTLTTSEMCDSCHNLTGDTSRTDRCGLLRLQTTVSEAAGPHNMSEEHVLLSQLTCPSHHCSHLLPDVPEPRQSAGSHPRSKDNVQPAWTCTRTTQSSQHLI